MNFGAPPLPTQPFQRPPPPPGLPFGDPSMGFQGPPFPGTQPRMPWQVELQQQQVQFQQFQQQMQQQMQHQLQQQQQQLQQQLQQRMQEQLQQQMQFFSSLNTLPQSLTPQVAVLPPTPSATPPLSPVTLQLNASQGHSIGLRAF